MYVLYHIVLGVQKRVTDFGSRPDPFAGHGGVDTFDARLHDIPVSALVIDVADAAKRELVWRGVGIDEIDVNAKPEQTGQGDRQSRRDNPEELSAETRTLKRRDDDPAIGRTNVTGEMGIETSQGPSESRISVTGRLVIESSPRFRASLMKAIAQSDERCARH